MDVTFVCECAQEEYQNKYRAPSYVAIKKEQKNKMWMRVGMDFYFTDDEVKKIANASEDERREIVETCYLSAIRRGDFELVGETYSNEEFEHFNYIVDENNHATFVGKCEFYN